jgi:hypothetical protein
MLPADGKMRTHLVQRGVAVVVGLHARAGAVAEKNLDGVLRGAVVRGESSRAVPSHIQCGLQPTRTCDECYIMQMRHFAPDGTHMRGVLPLPVAASTLTPPSSNATSTSRWPS